MKTLTLAAVLAAHSIARAGATEPPAAPVSPTVVPEVPAAPTETAEAKATRLAADKAAKEQAKAEAKAKKDAEKLAAKQAKEQEVEAKKVAKANEAQAADAAKEAEKKAAAQKKIDDAAAAKAAKEAQRQPEQNGIRRPKPDTLCGKAWAIFDQISGANGTPAAIGEAMPVAKTQGLNEANVRTEYARWRKFHNVSGRIDAPKPVQEPAVEPAPTTPIEAAAAPVAPAPPTA